MITAFVIFIFLIIDHSIMLENDTRDFNSIIINCGKLVASEWDLTQSWSTSADTTSTDMASDFLQSGGFYIFTSTALTPVTFALL